MDDLFNSLPLVFFFICCFIIIVPFSALIIFLILKSRGEAWSGVIIKRVHNQTEDMDDKTHENYYFIVKMDKSLVAIEVKNNDDPSSDQLEGLKFFDKDGQPVEKLTGYHPKDVLAEYLESKLA